MSTAPARARGGMNPCTLKMGDRLDTRRPEHFEERHMGRRSQVRRDRASIGERLGNGPDDRGRHSAEAEPVLPMRSRHAQLASMSSRNLCPSRFHE